MIACAAAIGPNRLPSAISTSSVASVAPIAVARRVTRGGANSTPTVPPRMPQQSWTSVAPATSPVSAGGLKMSVWPTA